MALLDELQNQSASLKSIMPPIQLYKDFIVSYEIGSMSISLDNYWRLAIKELRSRITNIEKLHILTSKKGRPIKISFSISVRLIDKEELKTFIDTLYDVSKIDSMVWYSHKINIQIQRSHAKFEISTYTKQYDEIAKTIFENLNDN